MKIDSIKELAKLISLCQKTGVLAIKVDNIELHISPVSKSESKAKSMPIIHSPEADIKVPLFNGQPIVTHDEIDSEELTEEQKLFWSTGIEAN